MSPRFRIISHLKTAPNTRTLAGSATITSSCKQSCIFPLGNMLVDKIAKSAPSQSWSAQSFRVKLCDHFLTFLQSMTIFPATSFLLRISMRMSGPLTPLSIREILSSLKLATPAPTVWLMSALCERTSTRGRLSPCVCSS